MTDGLKLLTELYHYSQAAVTGSRSAEGRLKKIAAKILFDVSPTSFVCACGRAHEGYHGGVELLAEYILRKDEAAVRTTSNADAGPISGASGGGSSTRHDRAIDSDTLRERIKRELVGSGLEWFFRSVDKARQDAGLASNFVKLVSNADCRACRHPRLVELNSQLYAGHSLRDVSAWTAETGFGVSKSGLSDHRRKCLGYVGGSGKMTAADNYATATNEETKARYAK